MATVAPMYDGFFLSPMPDSSLSPMSRLTKYWQYLDFKNDRDLRARVRAGGWGKPRFDPMSPREELIRDTWGDKELRKNSYKRFDGNAARKAGTRHKVISLESKNPGILKSATPDGKVITDTYSRNRKNAFGVKRTHTTVNKKTVKTVTHKPAPKVDSSKWFSKARKTKWVGLAITTAALAVASNFLNSFSDRTYGQLAPTAQSLGMWSRDSTYIPEKYARGYDTIKQHMTDFGSRVNLAKTVQKVNVTPPNTVRQGMVTTTGSITRSNLALQAHSNAINHTRY